MSTLTPFSTKDFTIDTFKNLKTLNTIQLLDYLRKNISIFPKNGALSITKFKHGQSNPTFLLKCQQSRFVLRKKPSGKLLPSAHAIEREYFVMKALQNSRVPVPICYHLCTDTNIIGTAFYVCEFVDGIVFTDCQLNSIKNKNERFAIYSEMNRILAEIHSLDLQSLNLQNYSTSKRDHISRTIYRWNKQFENSSTNDLERKEVQELYFAINDYKRRDAAISTLVHGDFRLDNLIFDRKTLRILAVVDWELSTIGNPLSDIGTFCMIYNIPASASKATKNINGRYLGGIDVSALGIPTQLEFVRGWLTHLRPSCSIWKSFVFPIRDFNFYVAVALYRLVSIYQGIVARMKLGNASNPNKQMFNAQILKYMSIIGVQMLKNEDMYDLMLVGEKNVLPVHLEIFREKFSLKYFELRRKLLYFMEAYIIPGVMQKRAWFLDNPELCKIEVDPYLAALKIKAQELGLWNIFLPAEYEESPGLSNLEYASLCEIMGRAAGLAPEACNCSAPDTGNMEVLARYGTEQQKLKYLVPLMNGEIRSCFGMTEPLVASSDARNIQTSMIKTADGKYYVVNGRKWWTSGACDARCKICILMGKTSMNSKSLYVQQSMLIIEMNSPGITIVRHLNVFGYDDLPHGHAEVPVENMILGEGRGFEISQGRLGPGRIHHCMRLIGMAEVALKLMKNRVLTRYTFGKRVADHGTIAADIAQSRNEIEQARLLVLQTAVLMDKLGNRKARQFISMIKVVAPQMCGRIIDRAIQAYGGMGVCQDTPLAQLFAHVRSLRIADGPDEVHQMVVAKLELRNSKL